MQPIKIITRRTLTRNFPSVAIHQSRSLPSFATKSRFFPLQRSNLSQRIQPLSTVRYNSSLARTDYNQPEKPVDTQQPSYQLTFTCKPCGERSSHRVTKQGYHHGTVLIKCPGCENRHVIADHLKIFMDQKSTLEDILERKAKEGGLDLTKLLKKGKLGMRQGAVVGNESEEDIEFWEDGSETVRQESEK